MREALEAMFGEQTTRNRPGMVQPQNCRDRVSDYVLEAFWAGQKERGSPIETLLYAAIQARVMKSRFAGIRNQFYLSDTPTEDGELFPDLSLGRFLVIQEQKAIARYKADFLVWCYSKQTGYSRLVIECDGHDYHERTKEQAAHDRKRDREMQMMGFTVFRFTGSEIYNDPIACADGVIQWAESKTFPGQTP